MLKVGHRWFFHWPLQNLFMIFCFQKNNYCLLLGMTDKQTEGTWRWDSDGTVVSDSIPVEYSIVQWSNWYPNRPRNNSRENCAIMYKNIYNRGATWTDYRCRFTGSARHDKSLVCQKTKKERKSFSLFSIFFFLL